MAQSTTTNQESLPEGLNPKGSITKVPGVKVGHFTSTKRPTGFR